MLGSEVERVLKNLKLTCIGTDKEVDIRNIDRLFDFAKNHKPDWIINCSAYTQVDKAEDEEELAFGINSDGVLNVTKVAKKYGAKLIHISTDYVFDGTKIGPYLESDATNPIGVYGKSKLCSEQNVINNHDKYFIIRTAWLYGFNGNNFVNTMLKLLKEKDEIKVVDDQYGSPTYAEDLARFVAKIVARDLRDYGVFNFTNEGETNWYQFACEINKQAQIKGLVKRDVRITPIKTTEYPRKAMRPANSYLSKEKVKKVFNYSIRDWREALGDFLSSSPL